MEGAVDGAVCPAAGEVCFVGAAAGVSPETGVVPGAGWAWGVLAGVVLDPVDCAHSPVDSASATTASDPALNPANALSMTRLHTAAEHAASLHCLDASILLLGNNWEE